MRAVFIRAIILFAFCVAGSPFLFSEPYTRTVYLSSSLGSDSNIGNESNPKFSINALPAELRQNTRILLRRGDVFYGYIQGFENCEISAYGSGPDPIVSGFRVLDNTSAWVSNGNGVWRLDLSKNENFRGIDPDFQMIPGNLNNIGCIYDMAADTIIGHMVDSPDKLTRNGDFFTRSDNISPTAVKDNPFSVLYLKSDVNPSQLGFLAFSTGNHGMYDMGDCLIKDISFVGYGNHGACGIRSSKIEHCTFDVIGGSIQIDAPSWVRYGNGVELWGNRQDVTVADCLISRVYDAATTIQCTGPHLPVNLNFINNRIYRCRQAYEYWYINNDTPAFPDCSFRDNICYRMGDNDFDSREWRDADILCYQQQPIEMEISGNTFFDGSYFCSSVANPALRDNTVYILPGQYLNSYWTSGYRRIVVTKENFDAAVQEYRDRFGDNSRIILLDPNSAEYKSLQTSILRKINWRPPRLY